MSETLTITYSNDAWETFVEALRWPIEKNYNVVLTFSDGSTCEAQLEPRRATEESGDIVFRFRRRVELDGESYVSDQTEPAWIWSDSRPYVTAVHVH